MKEYIAQGSRMYWKAIAALFSGSFVTFAVLYCTQPLIPVFSAEFHTSPAVASLSISLATGALAVCMLAISWVSDAQGRKIIMTVALITAALLTIGVAFCHNFILLLLLRGLQGGMLAGFPAIAMAYINEEFNPQNSGLVMGIYVSGTAIGGMLGRIIIGTLTDLFSWHVALGTIGAISLLVSLLFWYGLPDSRNFIPRRKNLAEIWPALLRNLRQPLLAALYLEGFLIMGSFVAVYNYIGYTLMAPPYNLSHTAVGFIFLIYLVGTFSSTSMGKLADQAGSSKALCLSVAIMLLGCIISLHTQLAVKLVGLIIFTFGFFGSHAVVSNWVGKSAPDSKAQASSLYLLFYYIGSSVIGTLAGEFLKWRGWPGVVVIVGGVLTLALVVSWLLFLPRRQECIRPIS